MKKKKGIQKNAIISMILIDTIVIWVGDDIFCTTIFIFPHFPLIF